MSSIDFDAVRRQVVALIRGVNRETETEVLAAGGLLHSIVDTARGHIESTKEAMQRLSGRDRKALSAVLAQQAQLVDDHVAVFRGDVSRHVNRAQTAVSHVATISEAARSIAAFTRQAHILSINAQIEAARVAEGSGFRVIAKEMRGLAASISASNKAIQELAASLGAVLPAMAEDASVLTARTEAFAGKATAASTEIARSVSELEESTVDLVAQGDQVIAAILDDSHAALSHLQFQDVCAQRLLGIDRELRKLQIVYHRSRGDDDAQVAPEANHELGGGAGAAGTASGDVRLF